MRTCTRCNVPKSLSAFYMYKDRNRHRAICAACIRAHARQEYPKKRWVAHIQQRYGLTPQMYYAMLEAQGGACKICRGTNQGGRKLSIDHDHKTGRLRALVCIQCNLTLGGIERVGSTAPFQQYLDKHASPPYNEGRLFEYPEGPSAEVNRT